MSLSLPQLTARLEVCLRIGLRHSIIALMLALLPSVCLAQNSPKVTLDTSETLFTILASMNACGYDQELNVSDPVRKQIRGEVNRAAHDSDDALEASNVMCQYYHEHIRPDPPPDRAQYTALALYWGGPANCLHT